MKENILKQLKTKYKDLGLSQSALNGVAELLSKTVKEESEIEAAVSGVEGLLKGMQSETDRLRTELAEARKKQEPLPNEPIKPKEQDTKTVELPEDVKTLLEELKQDRQLKVQQEKLQLLRTDAKSKLKEKGIKDSLCDLYLSEVAYSESLTADDLAQRIEDKHNKIVAETVGESGRVPLSTGGGETIPTAIQKFLADKATELESQKLQAEKFK